MGHSVEESDKKRFLLDLFSKPGAPPVLVFILLSAILYGAGPEFRSTTFVFEPPWLLFTLNTVFITALCLLIAWLCFRFFLRGGFLNVLLLGSGVFAFGLSSFAAGWLIRPPFGPNYTVTIHNIGVLCAAVLFFLSSLFTAFGFSMEIERRRSQIAVMAYATVFGLGAFLTTETVFQSLPPFFVVGEGPTVIRQVVLSNSVTLLLTSALLMMTVYAERKTGFLLYSINALLLIGTGIAGVALAVPGSPLSWLGRASQYLGDVYLVIAVHRALSEAKARGTTVETALADFFKKSETHYRALVEMAADAIVAIDREGRILLMNPAAEEIFGYGKTEARGKYLEELIVPEQSRDPFHSCLSGESHRDMEMELTRKDGFVFPAELSFSPQMKSDGGSERTIIIHDVTERRRAEEALRESESRFRTLAGATFEGVAVTEEGRLADINEQFCAISGFDRSELLGMDVSKLVHPDDRDRVLDNILTGRESLVEHRMIRKDGSLITVEAHGKTVRHDGRDRRLTAVRDVTEARKAEEAVRSAALFPLQNPSPVLRIHRDGTLLFSNSAAELILAMWRDESGYVIPARVRLAVEAALNEGVSQELDIQTARKVFSFVIAPVSAGVYANLYGRDVTERKRAEEALRRSEARYRSYIEVTGQMGWTTNADGEIAEDIPNWREYTGQSFDEMRGWGWSGALHSDDREITLAVWRKAVEEKRGYETEYRLRRHDGVYRHFLARGVPVFQDDGNVREWVGTCIDITDRRQAEDALRQSESRFRLLSGTAGRLLATDNPQGLINELCRDVMKHLDCQAFFNFMVDEASGRLHLNACAGIPEEEVRKLEWLDYGVAVCGCVARDKVRIVAEDIFHTPDARTELVRSYGIQAYCCHPLRARDRLIGTLSFGTKTRARFTPEEVELMRTVADQVAIALQRIQARQELAEAHQILQLALNAGGMGTWAWDLRTNRSTWNPQEYRLLGLPAGSGAADTELFFRQVHPEDAPALREAIGDAVAHSSVLEQEFRILRADDGQVRWLSSMGSVVRDEEGQPTALMGISYDITDRRNREEELRKLNRTLRAMSNSSQALIRAEEEAAYLDEVCRIIVADCGYAMVWIGYAENDEAKTIRPVSHAGFEDGYLETLHLTWADTERGRGPTGTAIRTGKPSKCTDMLSDPRFTPWREEALRRGYASSMVLPLLSDGNAFGAVTIYSKRPDPFSEEEEKLLTELADDLTYGITAIRLRLENRKAQEALSESEKRFRELSDAMPQLVWTAEPDGRVDYFNRRITEFKYDRGATPVIHPEDLPLTVKTWQRGLNSGRDYEIEHRMQRADGSFRWFLSRAVPIRDKKNRVIKWYGTSTDVDDRKKAEEALRKSREELEDRVRERTAELTLTLEDLETSQDNLRKLASELVLTEERERKKISVTLHDEVAQTLAAIRMRIDLLRGMQGNEASRRTLDEAQQLLVQAIRETRSLMTDISNPVLYDMGLKVAIQSLAEDMNARQGVSFSSVFGGRLKNLGQDMEVMIFQVVKELAQNVLKHSGALKASIRVVEERDDIKVVVADDGLGFDVGSIGAVGSDSGFGLFSIRERVKSYNGKIKIESEPGKGSEITVLLPKKAADVAASRRTGKKKQNIQ